MFHGSLVALVTPMHASGQIDEAAFCSLIDWHIESGTEGLVVLGTTGETATVRPDERELLIKLAVNHTKGRVPVIIGTGTNSTSASIALTKQAMHLGADAVLLVTPYYLKPTQMGLYAHFKAIADQVPIPQILYNVPSRTGCDLLPETVERLAPVPNIVALKEATGDLHRFNELLPFSNDITLLSGEDSTALDFIVSGGRGVISVTANVVPALMKKAVQAALEKSSSSVDQYKKELHDLNDVLFVESNPIPVKWLLHKMGRIPSGIRLPLTPLSESHHAALVRIAQAAGIALQ